MKITYPRTRQVMVLSVIRLQHLLQTLSCGLKSGQVLEKNGERGRNRIRAETANKDLTTGVSCDKHLARLNPSQGSELCAVAEYMFSLEQCLAILGDPALGDRLERLAFNALPGTMTDDISAHQYDQESSQVEYSLHHKPGDQWPGDKTDVSHRY